MTKPCVAASSYLNAAPLCYSFIDGDQKELCDFISDAAPARCAEMLAERRADAALIPVIEYQRIDGLTVAPGACVASKARVRSVLLASKVAIEDIKSVALDTSSRTSAALVRIILGGFYRISASYTTLQPHLSEMLNANDAALIIGDPAMLIDRSGLQVYDLAEEWGKHTGLPFVFAFWAVRDDSTAWSEQPSGAQGRVNFRVGMLEGLRHVAEIADDYSSRLGLPKSELIEYLTENISYELDAESIRGLKLYYQMAHEAGLIEAVRDLVFAD